MSLLDKWPKVAKLAATFTEADWSPPLYNVWSYGAKSNAVAHFGNSEQCILDNLVYLFTEPFDTVVDPFAGGGRCDGRNGGGPRHGQLATGRDSCPLGRGIRDEP